MEWLAQRDSGSRVALSSPNSQSQILYNPSYQLDAHYQSVVNDVMDLEEFDDGVPQFPDYPENMTMSFDLKQFTSPPTDAPMEESEGAYMQHPQFNIVDSRNHISLQENWAIEGAVKRTTDGYSINRLQLKPVSLLPDAYRGLFKFGVFNAVQSECFADLLYSNRNLVASAPTGSGKTVLFELAVLKMLLYQGAQSKAVYIAPTKALCNERFRDWSSKFGALGVTCSELTGDTVLDGVNPWNEAKNARIIITTPEKLDSLTRGLSQTTNFWNSFELLLVDEVHILNEPRGCTLEVVISRLRLKNPHLRFVLVSATVPNIADVADWIFSNDEQAALIKQFGDDYRPCKLKKYVYGFPRKNQNEFQFVRSLDFHLFDIIERHGEKKPVLIFVSTRKSALSTAEVLMKEYKSKESGRIACPWVKPSRLQFTFKDHHLQELASYGVGIHHAGLSLEDRRLCEDLYSDRVISVMVATSTLAVGMNLPAHLVILKGVKIWVDGIWRNYSEIDVMQMIGRAGRPQFDKEGIAAVLCEKEQELKYSCLVSEHLNSEIALGTISDISSAQRWIRGSFLYQRIQKNPTHYGLNKPSGQTWQGRLNELVVDSITRLQTARIIERREDSDFFNCTEYGIIMFKYYLKYSTMSTLMSMPTKPSIRDLLEIISSSAEFSDIRLRSGEKQLYNKIRQDEAIRFSIRKVESVPDKIFILLQAILGGVALNTTEYRSSDSQPQLEANSVLRSACRIARVIAEIAIVDQKGAQLKYGLELVRALSGRAWEDRPVVLRQLERLGDKSTKVLALNGITNFETLRVQDTTRLELLLNRRPPFGHNLLTAAKRLPQYTLSVEKTAISSGAEELPSINLKICCSLISDEIVGSDNKNSGKRTSKFLGMTSILTLTSDLELVDYRRIPTKALRGGKSFSVQTKLTKPSQSIMVQISPDNFAGLSVVETFKPGISPKHFPVKDTRPLNAVGYDLQELENNPEFWAVDLEEDVGNSLKSPEFESLQSYTVNSGRTRSSTGVIQQIDTLQSYTGKPRRSRSPAGVVHQIDSPKRLVNGNYLCKHTCKDKANCRHLCCRDGLARPRQSDMRHAYKLTRKLKEVPRVKESFQADVAPRDAFIAPDLSTQNTSPKNQPATPKLRPNRQSEVSGRDSLDSDDSGIWNLTNLLRNGSKHMRDLDDNLINNNALLARPLKRKRHASLGESRPPSPPTSLEESGFRETQAPVLDTGLSLDTRTLQTFTPAKKEACTVLRESKDTENRQFVDVFKEQFDEFNKWLQGNSV